MNSNIEIGVLNFIDHDIKLLAQAASIAEVLGISEHLKGELHRQVRILLHSFKAFFSERICFLSQVIHNFFEGVGVEAPINQLTVFDHGTSIIGVVLANMHLHVVHHTLVGVGIVQSIGTSIFTEIEVSNRVTSVILGIMSQHLSVPKLSLSD